MPIPEVFVSVSLGFISGAVSVLSVWYWFQKKEKKNAKFI
jgi:hypothetical protein